MSRAAPITDLATEAAPPKTGGPWHMDRAGHELRDPDAQASRSIALRISAARVAAKEFLPLQALKISRWPRCRMPLLLMCNSCPHVCPGRPGRPGGSLSSRTLRCIQAMFASAVPGFALSYVTFCLSSLQNTLHRWPSN